MYAAAHQGVDFLLQRFVGQQLLLSLNDLFVISHGRPCLCVARMHRACLARSLLDQGQHHAERQSVSLKDIGSEGVTMIGKVAGKDCCQMQVAALVA